jgi:amino acid transporter
MTEPHGAGGAVLGVERAWSVPAGAASPLSLSKEVASPDAPPRAVSEKEVEPPRSMGALRFAAVAFVAVSAGPFGMEVAVQAAGPLWVVVGVLVFAVMWSLPQSLITASLASTFHKNGGTVQFAMTALGPFWGWMAAYNNLMTQLFDVPVYPVLFAAYVRDLGGWSQNSWEDWCVKGGALALVLAFNVVGMELVSTASAVFTLLMLMPFLVEPFLVHQHPSAWVARPPQIDWAVFVATTLWGMQGWESLGALAGEVKDVGRTYPRGVMMALALVVVMYIVPICTAASVDPDTASWEDGSFAVIASKVHPWLGTWLGVSAALSALGEFNAVIGTTSRAIQCMADYNMLPRLLSHNWSRTATPVAAILVQSVFIVGLMSFDFEDLVVADTVFNNFLCGVQIASYITYRIRRPDVPRPYELPGGLVGAWAAVISTNLVILVSTVLMLHRPGLNLYFILGAEAVIALAGVAYIRCVPPATLERIIHRRSPDARDTSSDGQGQDDDDVIRAGSRAAKTQELGSDASSLRDEADYAAAPSPPPPHDEADGPITPTLHRPPAFTATSLLSSLHSPRADPAERMSLLGAESPTALQRGDATP